MELFKYWWYIIKMELFKYWWYIIEMELFKNWWYIIEMELKVLMVYHRNGTESTDGIS